MKWFKKMILKWVKDDWNNHGEVAIADRDCIVSSGSDIDMDNGFRFTVMPARGGTIVQLRSYNRKTDRNIESTHVISEGESVADRIGQIVSMELLQGHPSDR